MKRERISWIACLVSLFGLLLNISYAESPEVDHVHASQRGDGSKEVVITYDVSDPDDETVSVELEITADGNPVEAATLTGHIGEDVPCGTGRRIVWDAGADWDGQYSDNVVFSITASDQKGDLTNHVSADFRIDWSGYGDFEIFIYLSGPHPDLGRSRLYNGYRIGVHPKESDNPNAHIIKYVNGTHTYLATRPNTIHAGEVHNLRVEYGNGQLNVFLDDTLFMSASDDTFSSGDIYFRTHGPVWIGNKSADYPVVQ